MKNIASMRKTSTLTYNFKTFEPGLNTIKSDATLSPNTARMCYNYEFRDGNLKNGLGIKFFQVVNGNFTVTGNQPQFCTVSLPANFHPVCAYHYQFYDNGVANKVVLISQ